MDNHAIKNIGPNREVSAVEVRVNVFILLNGRINPAVSNSF